MFFFSSRRRHTRLVSDWSSDVCSSDLQDGAAAFGGPRLGGLDLGHAEDGRDAGQAGAALVQGVVAAGQDAAQLQAGLRSEERRVGKGGGWSGWGEAVKSKQHEEVARIQ